MVGDITVEYCFIPELMRIQKAATYHRDRWLDMTVFSPPVHLCERETPKLERTCFWGKGKREITII